MTPISSGTSIHPAGPNSIEPSDLVLTLLSAIPRATPREHDILQPSADAAVSLSTGPRAVAPTPTRGANGAAGTAAAAGPRPSRVARLWRAPPTTVDRLTREGLAAWETDAHISDQERQERGLAAKRMRWSWVLGNLDLRGFTELTALPAGLAVRGDLDLFGCPGLTALPAGLTVGGYFRLGDCAALTALPAGLAVRGNLCIWDCRALTALPAGLTVGRDLNIQDCQALATLPENLTVGCNLYLDGCTRLTTLPAGLTVGRNVRVHDCTGLTALPEEILTWGPCRDQGRRRTRHIYLEGSGLGASIQARVEHMQPAPAGMQFHFSMPQEPDAGFTSLTEGVAFWGALAPALPPTIPDVSAWRLGAIEANDLKTFLGRLRQTADCRNAAVRPTLAARVVAMLVAMQDATVRGMALERIGEALVSCGDRVVLMLNQIELATRAHALTGRQASDAALRALGLALLKLEVVHRHAARATAQLVMVDEIEVYLAFETRLRERLGLPVSTQTMLYEPCANVTEAMLDAADTEAMEKAAVPENLAAYLATWEPWQIQARRMAMAHAAWETLPQQHLDAAWLCDAQCCISLAPYASLQAPVALPSGRQWVICEYGAFADWWVRTGLHPTLANQVFALDTLRRPTGSGTIRQVLRHAPVQVHGGSINGDGLTM